MWRLRKWRRNRTKDLNQPKPKPRVVYPRSEESRVEQLSRMHVDLCSRCKAFSDSIEYSWTTANEGMSALEPKLWQTTPNGIPVAFIDEGPYKDSCHLCAQFRNFLDGGRLELRYHEVWDNEWASAYFSIIQPKSRRESCLVPTEAFFRHPCGNNKRETLVRSVQTEKPNLGLVNGWLNYCRLNHENSCRAFASRGTVPKRLIDCQQKQLCINSGEPYPYVCLSYTWGNTSASQPDRDPGLPHNLPQLILDAMFVTIRLGQRYLWIDRYCIDQQNTEEKHNIIQNMDDIYQAAELTIIAAAGSDPHYGLPGVSRSRKACKTLKLHDHVFTTIESPRQEIATSKWNTRGWTYQEMFMSRRRVVFTETQIYFQCLSMHCLERMDPITECSGPLLHGFQAFPVTEPSTRAHRLYDLLIEYYPRELSYNTDILDAFEGIFHSYEQSKDPCTINMTHFYGIPIHFYKEPSPLTKVSFALGLTWQVFKKSEYRGHYCVYDGYYPAHLRNKLFPSWSWASFKAQRPTDDSGQLAFHRRPPAADEIFKPLPFDQELQISVTHRSGIEMSLQEFIGHPDDYTRFHPRVDIESMTTTCRLSSDHKTVKFAEHCQQLVLAHLHRDPRCLSSMILTAVLVAILPMPQPRKWQAVFLLVEQVTYLDEYRLVGVCCDGEHVPIQGRGWDQGIREACRDVWDVDEGPNTWDIGEGLELCRYWKWQTLRII